MANILTPGFLYWDGSKYILIGTAPSTGSAGGDLSGAYPNPTVTKINGVIVTGNPTTGQAIIAVNPTTASWQTFGGGGTNWNQAYTSFSANATLSRAAIQFVSFNTNTSGFTPLQITYPTTPIDGDIIVGSFDSRGTDPGGTWVPLQILQGGGPGIDDPIAIGNLGASQVTLSSPGHAAIWQYSLIAGRWVLLSSTKTEFVDRTGGGSWQPQGDQFAFRDGTGGPFSAHTFPAQAKAYEGMRLKIILTTSTPGGGHVAPAMTINAGSDTQLMLPSGDILDIGGSAVITTGGTYTWRYWTSPGGGFTGPGWVLE